MIKDLGSYIYTTNLPVLIPFEELETVNTITMMTSVLRLGALQYEQDWQFKLEASLPQNRSSGEPGYF
jgi:hypothetical protein